MYIDSIQVKGVRYHLGSVGSTDIASSDGLDVADPQGNVILSLQQGEVRSKNFDSKNTPAQTEDNSEVDLQIADDKGNVILELKDGHIRTKNFDSRAGCAEVVRSEDGRNILILNKGGLLGGKGHL